MASNVLGAALGLLQDRKGRIDTAIKALVDLAEVPPDVRERLLGNGHIEAEVVSRKKYIQVGKHRRICENPDCPKRGGKFLAKHKDARFCSLSCASTARWSERRKRIAKRQTRREKAGLNGKQLRVTKAGKRHKATCRECKSNFLTTLKKPRVCADCKVKIKAKALLTARAALAVKRKENASKEA